MTAGANLPPCSTRPRKAAAHRFRPTAFQCILTCTATLLLAALLCGCSTAANHSQPMRSRIDTDLAAAIDARFGAAITLQNATLSDQVQIFELSPISSNTPQFSYYHVGLQRTLTDAVACLQETGTWTASNPLAILNPFGTGANGLYLYFQTPQPTCVTYTVQTEGAPDFTATARDVAVTGAIEAVEAEVALPATAGYEQIDSANIAFDLHSSESPAVSVATANLSATHSFQIIGLVPGQKNHVELTLTDAENHIQTYSFDLTMPPTASGYPTQLEITQNNPNAAQNLSNGLYTIQRVNGYLDYGFFFSNSGTLRYEMVTDTFGLDRFMLNADGTITLTSTQAVATIDALGRVTRLYPAGAYSLHHDINAGPGGTVIALAEKTGRQTVEDVVIEMDLETGTITELVDFSALMADFREQFTHPILPTSMFSWQAGEWDWIHLNSVEYLAKDDAIIVSSRETSTIIKVDNVHSRPTLSCFIGDETYWADTGYQELNLQKTGDFVAQYGQHSVQYDGAGNADGAYYLLMFDNNFWTSVTRDDFTPALSGTTTSTQLYEGTESYVYRYRVDETARTFSLVDSFAVPYSSIVSNVSRITKSTNFVVNSGVVGIMGEYTEKGQLIREFSYPCEMQGYRSLKETFEDFWFQGDAIQGY